MSRVHNQDFIWVMVWYKNGVENLKMDKLSCLNDDHHDEGGQGQTDHSSGGGAQSPTWNSSSYFCVSY